MCSSKCRGRRSTLLPTLSGAVRKNDARGLNAMIPNATEPVGTWRRHTTSLRNLFKLAALLWRTNSTLFIGTIILRGARALVPLGLLWIPKKIIDSVLAATKGYPDRPHL